jgi:hypothetical protein
MISVAHLRRATDWLGRFLVASFLLILFCAPQRMLAAAPQSADTPPAQQPAPPPARKDSVATVADTAAKTNADTAAKTNSGKPHRVFTNDDISSAPSVPVAPGARRRLKQLNRCDRSCFNDVKKQALQFGYTSVYPRSTREEMDDRLANYIEELQGDPKWQQLLLEMISAHLESCAAMQKSAASPDDAPTHTLTRAEILAEEERNRQPRQTPGNSLNATSSAVLAYRFKINPDPLKASLMVHQYMDEIHLDCPPASPSADSDANADSDP